MNCFESETLSSSSEAPTSSFSKKNVRLRKIRKIEDQSLLDLSESDTDNAEQTARKKRPKLSFLPKIDLEENSQQRAIRNHKTKVNRSSLKKNNATLKVKLGKYKIEGKRMQNHTKTGLTDVKPTAASRRKSINSPETSKSLKKNLNNPELEQVLSDAPDFDNEPKILKPSRVTKMKNKSKKRNSRAKINLKQAYVSLIPLEKTNLLSEEQLLELISKNEYDSDELPLNTINFNKTSSMSRQRKLRWGKENSFEKETVVATNTPAASSVSSLGHVQDLKCEDRDVSKKLILSETYPTCRVMVERLTLEKLHFLACSESNRQLVDTATARGEMLLSQSNMSDTTTSFYTQPSVIDNESMSRKSGTLTKTKQSLSKPRRSSKMFVENNCHEPSFELQVFNPEGSSSPFVPTQEPTAETSSSKMLEITSNVSTSVTKCLTYELEAETEPEKADHLVDADSNSGSRNATYEILVDQANQSSRKSIKIRRVFEELPYYSGDLHREEEMRELKNKSVADFNITSSRKSKRTSKNKSSTTTTSLPTEEDKQSSILHNNNSTYELNATTNVENDGFPIAEFNMASSRKSKRTSKGKSSTTMASLPTEEDKQSSILHNNNSTYELNATTNVEDNGFPIAEFNMASSRKSKRTSKGKNSTAEAFLPTAEEKQSSNSDNNNSTCELNATTNVENTTSIPPVDNNMFEIEVPNFSGATNIQSDQNTSNRTLPLLSESQKVNTTYDLETSTGNTASKSSVRKRSKSCGSLNIDTVPKVVKTREFPHSSMTSVLPSVLKQRSFLDYSNVTQRKRRTLKSSNDNKSKIGLDDVSTPWSSDFDGTVQEAEESQVTSTSNTFWTGSAQATDFSDTTDTDASDNDEDSTSVSSVSSSSSSNTDSTSSWNLPTKKCRFEKDTFERSKPSSALFGKIGTPKSSLKKSNSIMHDTKNRRVTFSDMSVIIVESDASFSSPEAKPSGTPVPTHFHSVDDDGDDSDEPLAELSRELQRNKRSTAGRTPMHVKKHVDSPLFNKSGSVGRTPIPLKASAASPHFNRQRMTGRTPLRIKISSKAMENSFASPGLNRKIDSDDRAKLLQSPSVASPARKNVNSGRIPSRTKMPNFASMHQKLFDKMPDIKQYLEQKKERANLILSGHKVPKGNSSLMKSAGKIVETANYNLGKKITTKKQLVFPSETGTSKAASKPNVFSIAPTITSTPKGKKNQEQGFTRYGFRAGQVNIPKKDQIMAVANKTKPLKSKTVENRNEIKGVRSNRRFDLMMQLRKKKMSGKVP